MSERASTERLWTVGGLLVVALISCFMIESRMSESRRSAQSARAMRVWLNSLEPSVGDSAVHKIADRSLFVGDPRAQLAPAWAGVRRTAPPRLHLFRATRQTFVRSPLAQQGAPRVADSGLTALPSIANDLDDDRARAVNCLGAAVYYEAANEPLEGQEAVAQVVLNRARTAGFPKTVCGVVFQGSNRATGCQFTFTCDGSLMRRPSANSWRRAQAVAERVLDGEGVAAVEGATHYHASYVRPYWSAFLTRIVQIGAHIFYRDGGRHAPFGRAAPGMYASSGEVAPLIDPLGSAPVVKPASSGIPPAARRRNRTLDLRVVTLTPLRPEEMTPGRPIVLGRS